MADHDMSPIMKDIAIDGLELGLKQSSENFGRSVRKRKMTVDQFIRKQRSISPQVDYSGFKNVDLIIEAIVENMDVKKKVFSEVEKHVTKTCLLTSNTSSLEITEMAKALEHPERFAGLHFFNPVHKMPLVEIITHDKLSAENLESLYKWVLKTKKTPIVVKDGPGFLVNRILAPFLNEASYLLEEGVSIKDLDNACLNFGMPMGPCRLMDEVGIDVAHKVGKILFDGLGSRFKPSELSSKLIDAGFLGKKNSRGFYIYDEKGKSIEINDDIESLLPAKTNKMDETTIQMRVFLPMINEAASILQDRIVDTAENVDLGLIFGIGFPPFRGGLLKYADTEGLDRIVEALKKFAGSVDSNRYGVNGYLQNLVDKNKKFYDN
jgi:3-hydroxyacyl-CoA dehydrogenase/enoyl-CoA hydratase/3-hydroxybutyryl-CoA epimerase